MDRLAELNDNMLPFAKLLGINFVTAELDRVVAELLIRDDLCNRRAIAQGVCSWRLRIRLARWAPS